MVEISSLAFRYPDGTSVFSDFSWKIYSGETWSVLGLSGTGKTTLLYLLAGILKPQVGTVRIKGELLKRPRPETGLVLQNNGLLPWATVEQNIMLGFRIRKFYGPDSRHSPAGNKSDRKSEQKKVSYWMERLGIEGQKDSFPSRISGGQRQRAALARTLVLEPDLLLMDEPFGALDVRTREDLQDLIIAADSSIGRTGITVTHSLEEAAVMGKKILIIGKPGTPPRIVDNPGSGAPGYRESSEFAGVCARLREKMESIN